MSKREQDEQRLMTEFQVNYSNHYHTNDTWMQDGFFAELIAVAQSEIDDNTNAQRIEELKDEIANPQKYLYDTFVTYLGNLTPYCEEKIRHLYDISDLRTILEDENIIDAEQRVDFHLIDGENSFEKLKQRFPLAFEDLSIFVWEKFNEDGKLVAQSAFEPNFQHKNEYVRRLDNRSQNELDDLLENQAEEIDLWHQVLSLASDLKDCQNDVLYLEKEKELANHLDRLWDLGSETGEDYFHHLEEYQLSVYHPARRLLPMISQERLNEIAQSPNFQRWFNAEKVHTEFKDENHLPKIFYRGLNIEPDDIHTVKTGNENSRYIGEYFTNSARVAISYIDNIYHEGAILTGFLNRQSPAVIDCDGALIGMKLRQMQPLQKNCNYLKHWVLMNCLMIGIVKMISWLI